MPIYVHPDGGHEVEANPASLSDHESLLESGFQLAEGEAHPFADGEVASESSESADSKPARKKRKSKADSQPE